MECGLAKREVINVMENMLRNCPLNMVYYNLVFTDKEIIAHYLISTYRSWILHVKPVKEYQYDGINALDIARENKESFVIAYKDVEQIIFRKRTFFTNARIEIKAKGFDEKIVLFSKNRIYVDHCYNIVQSYLKHKAVIK